MNLKINKQLVCVNNVKSDSRKVEKGDLFVCYKGVDVDAHDYIPQAIEKGATVIVGERNVKDIPLLYTNKSVKYFKVKDGRAAWSLLESQKYNHPQKKLKIIGITGTDGKTTTSNFIYTLLKNAGKKVGLISTINALYGNKQVSTGLHVTSLDPNDLFKILDQMVKEGIEYLVLEVTSHALIQKRLYGLNFEVCGVTNVTPEHLDAHGSYEQYIKDKALIFNQSKQIVLNKDGVGVAKIRKCVPKSKHIYFSTSQDTLAPKEFEINFPGDYNLQNLALAQKVVETLEIPVNLDWNLLFPNLKGRFERVPNEYGINIVVDFAHTPNSMKNVLSEVAKIKSKESKLVTVFGCAGERDIKKRPKMGKISSQFSDEVIITSEDPRSENPLKIIEQVVKGNSNYTFFKEPDRYKAIERALKKAKKGDWILILGKGHEQSMSFNGVEKPWDEKKAVLQILKTL